MTEIQKEIAIKIISFLKKKGLVQRSTIAEYVKISPFKNDFSTAIESLKEDGIISEPSHYVYKITTIGMLFESFEKINEEKFLEIALAKSNIEANELQKTIAERNEQSAIKNRQLTTIAIILSAILTIATVTQVLLIILK